MDLQEFLSLERKQLELDRQRLGSARSGQNCNNNDCPAALLMQTDGFVAGQCQRMANTSGECNEPTNVTYSTLATAEPNQNYELQVDLSGHKQEQEQPALPKSAKEFVNQRELLVGSARQYKSPNASYRHLEHERPQSENRLPIDRGQGRGSGRRRGGNNADDMEQWVTDTFYSYFPGFNNENQKRQNYLRERQRENQQNFLKHQMLHPPATKQRRQVKLAPEETQTARSSHSSTSTSNSRTDKTDLELIVNSNPNYVAPKIKASSTRQQMLQDLGHVELSNIVIGDGINQRNMRSAELETARKKDYQRDLMQQIEEKRRSIEALREKELRQEEALTRRLEAQLKTMQLEEQLEKQRQRAEKARIDAEQNRIMREQLLMKLEQDAQAAAARSKQTKVDHSKLINNNKDVPDSHNMLSNNNKVYKYFSNSAHHEYRRGQPLPPAVDLEFELPQMAKIERECFHLCEKICPFCNDPLKSYESCCLRCQRKLALKMKHQRQLPSTEETDTPEPQNQHQPHQTEESDTCQSSYALVCVKCERLYALCTQCLTKSDVCRACQRERNVCMSCRRNLCSFCLEEIACGKDTERTHVNDIEDQQQQQKSQSQTDDAFRVLELNYTAESPAPENNTSGASPPYAFNIGPNSVFNADDYKPTPVKPLPMEEPLPTVSGSGNNSFEIDSADEQSMERVRRQTDKRLSRYLENYGDLAVKQHQQQLQQLQLQRSKSESRHRGTQTTPQTLGRRDVVLHEAATQNLSMPLLREMPKMTRKDTTPTPSEGKKHIDNLKKRWEVPAVQKFTVSSSSPKILTQVGAIRKQLQAARFFDDIEADD
ncbi:CG7110 [Drosophila busckii]|uniref:CG7110 n=1 Tax=Drosophila busckii TaxID=30019 RepID=A0A0M4EG16_DROBS|nr:CG7110 [Drosophila busckii]